MQTSNIELEADFIIDMYQNAVESILTSVGTGSSLQMSTSINSPEFIGSTLGLRSYFYHFFGWGVVVFLLVFYFLKTVVLDSEGKDKSQLTPHLLLLKTPALAVFPAYAELLDFCRGFMVADLPFLDDVFGSNLADSLDTSPDPFRIFYASLSVSATFLSALIVIVALLLVAGIAAYLSADSRPHLRNCAHFLFNFFYGGLAFASVVCIQGAFLNLAEDFTVISSFYILGILIWLFLLG